MPIRGTEKAVIIDANVALAWVLDRSYSAEAMAYVDHGWKRIAPEILIYEIGNALSYYVKTEAISAHRARTAYELIDSAVDLVSGSSLALGAFEMSVKTRHPIYDCLYLELARQRGLPLVSADRKLNALAAQFNIAVQSLDSRQGAAS